MLAVVRTGSQYAPAALAHFLPQRIAVLPDVPRNVVDAANGVSSKSDEQEKSGDQKKEDTEPVPPDSGSGYVALYGDRWQAISHAGEAFAVGEKVRITAIDGNKVIVQKL